MVRGLVSSMKQKGHVSMIAILIDKHCGNYIPEIASKTTKASNSMNRATLEVQSSSWGIVKSLSGEAKDKPEGCNNTFSTKVVVACVMDADDDGTVDNDGIDVG